MITFTTGVHVLYVDTNYVALTFPRKDKIPVLVQRNVGQLHDDEIQKILRQIKHDIDGEPFRKENGCWCLKLKERDDAQSNDNL